MLHRYIHFYTFLSSLERFLSLNKNEKREKVKGKKYRINLKNYIRKHIYFYSLKMIFSLFFDTKNEKDNTSRVKFNITHTLYIN